MGPVIAGIVGVRSPRFCVFGKTVSQAFQLEQSSQPNKIQISRGVYLFCADFLFLNFCRQIKDNKKFKILKLCKSEKEIYKQSNKLYFIDAFKSYSHIIQSSFGILTSIIKNNSQTRKL